jgi:predicted ATPase/DNA-binding SARP family transcriptional activator
MSQLCLFGLPSLDYQETLPLNTPSSLLFYLAVKGDWVSRSELAFLYRPDDTEAEALKYLRLQLHRAQQYPWAGSLEIEKNQIRWLCENDVIWFHKAIANKDWPKALELYKSPFFGKYSFSDLATYSAWIDLERDALEQSYRLALTKQIEIFEIRQAFHEASELSFKVWTLDELEEDTFQTHLRHLALSGQKDLALKRFANFSKLLTDELDSQPLEETLELIEQIRHDKPIALKITRETKHHLPGQSTRFIGRKRELLELSKHLSQPECRLLSLIGLGGTGKSRLALEFARSQLHLFADGVYFIELAALETEDAIVNNLAQVLNLQFSSNESPKAQLLKALRGKHMILVFDNFEHLLPQASLLTECLAASDKLKIVVTSRESLKLKSEWLYDISGLGYPTVAPDLSRDDLESFDAVRLFVNAAKRVQPQLEFSIEDVVTIAQISKQLEGLPLALELAASWVRIMPIERIAQELEKGYALLETELADVPERHRNLRTILDKTWESLSEKKRQTLAKLSVFSGGCTLEAAEHITGAHFSILLTLVNESLLRRVSTNRFNLHELIKQFSFEKLKFSGEDAHVREAHLGYYTEFAYQAHAKLHTEAQVEWKSRLRSEGENFRSALEWGFEHFPKDAIILTVNLGNYWEASGRFQEGEIWLHRALKLSTNHPAKIQASLHLKILSMAVMKDDFKQVEHLHKATLAMCRKAKDVAAEAEYCNLMGMATTNQLQFEAAQAFLEKGLELAEKANHDQIKNYLLLNLGHLAIKRNDLDAALDFLQACLSLARKRKDTRLEMIALCNMGGAFISLGKYDPCISISEEALTLVLLVDDQAFLPIIKGNLGYAKWQCGDRIEGEKFYREHLLLLYKIGITGNFVENLFELTQFWTELGYADDAVCLWGAAEHLRSTKQYPMFWGYNEIQTRVLGTVADAKREALIQVGKSLSPKDLERFIKLRKVDILQN